MTDELVSDCGCNSRLKYGHIYQLGTYVGSCPCGARLVFENVVVIYVGDYLRENDKRSHTFQVLYPIGCFRCHAMIGCIEAFCQGKPTFLLPARCETGERE